MTDLRLIAAAHMRAMVARFGCLDAVASNLNARWGGGHSKGTISRKLAGSLDWTIADVIALEDALGEYPVTRALELRRVGAAASAPEPMLSHVAHISREAGEAIAAMLAAEQSDVAGDRAQAMAELHDVQRAVERALARLGGGA